MRRKKVNINFNDIHDAALPEFSEGVEKGMTENVIIFSSPPVAIATVTAQRQNYSTKLSKSMHGTTADTKAKDAARVVLEKSLKKNGKYVDAVADGNAEIILLSGYHISKEPETVGERPAPDYVKARDGDNAGEFDIVIAVVKKARGYLVAFTPASNTEPNPANWTLHWTTRSRDTFTGFASGTKYKIAAAAAGSSKKLNFCNPVTRIAQ